MLLVFQTVFSVFVISRIESIGGGRAGGGGGWEAEGGLKQPLRLKEQCCAFSLWHKLTQSTKEAKTGVRSSLHGIPYSPINAPQDHEMHPRGFTASIKSRL